MARMSHPSGSVAAHTDFPVGDAPPRRVRRREDPDAPHLLVGQGRQWHHRRRRRVGTARGRAFCRGTGSSTSVETRPAVLGAARAGRSRRLGLARSAAIRRPRGHRAPAIPVARRCLASCPRVTTCVTTAARWPQLGRRTGARRRTRRWSTPVSARRPSSLRRAPRSDRARRPRLLPGAAPGSRTSRPTRRDRARRRAGPVVTSRDVRAPVGAPVVAEVDVGSRGRAGGGQSACSLPGCRARCAARSEGLHMATMTSGADHRGGLRDGAAPVRPRRATHWMRARWRRYIWTGWRHCSRQTSRECRAHRGARAVEWARAAGAIARTKPVSRTSWSTRRVRSGWSAAGEWSWSPRWLRVKPRRSWNGSSPARGCASIVPRPSWTRASRTVRGCVP